MKLPNSSSQWFIPMHVGLMALTLTIIFLAEKALASSDSENEDRYCLAQNIYFEAGNQPFAGKLAVAHVTLNRVFDLQFPNTICDVVYQTKTYTKSWTGKMIPARGMCQFSWYCDGKSDDPKDSLTLIEAIRVADIAMQDTTFDITSGSLWYHADYIHPYWADHLTYVIQIENHIFYK